MHGNDCARLCRGSGKRDRGTISVKRTTQDEPRSKKSQKLYRAVTAREQSART